MKNKEIVGTQMTQMMQISQIFLICVNPYYLCYLRAKIRKSKHCKLSSINK